MIKHRDLILNCLARLPRSMLALLLAVFFLSSPLFALAPVRVKIPATDFVLEPQPKGEKRVEVKNIDGGLRVRAPDPITVTLRAVLHLPPSSSADPKMQRMVVHFRTSSSFTSLQSSELIDGAKIIFSRNSDLSGDFSVKETTANAWGIERQPVLVSSQTVVRLTVKFSGGFEGVPAGSWDFVLTGIDVDFPAKLNIAKSVVDVTAKPKALEAIEKGKETPPPAPPRPSRPTTSDGVIYALAGNNDLLWYRHTGREVGAFSWADPAGKVVGKGWDVKQVFSGGEGVIYTIMANGDLLWYRHDGRNDGTFRWAATGGKKVGEGWDFRHVFSDGDGVIYAITKDGDLMWYRHDGRGDGSFRWAASEGKKVGEGWNFDQVFPGGSGVIYAVTSTGDLLWYRHDGREDGSYKWAEAEGKKVGTGWAFKRLFSAGNGVIYGVTDNGELMWYRHDGRSDGSFKWASNNGKKVGEGWDFKAVFSGEGP